MPPIKHSLLSASSAKRWMACPGSVALLQTLPPSPSTIYAAEGTVAHNICEHYLTYGIPKVDIEDNGQLGEIVEENGFEIKITKEMLEACDLYANTICDEMVSRGLTIKGAHGLLKDIDKKHLLIETKTTISGTNDLIGGTVDACVMDERTKTIIVFDFKYGKGIPVEAVGNEQLLIYALGISEYIKSHYGWDAEHFELCIIQPRCPHDDGPIRWFRVSDGYMAKFKQNLLEGMNRAINSSKEYKCGEHCRFCGAKHICPAIRNEVNESMQMAFAPTVKEYPSEPIKVETLTISQLSDIMKKIPVVEAFIKEIQERAYTLLNEGAKIPGFKLVRKRANRQWIDEEQVKATFGDKAIEIKVKTPAQLEKIVGDISEFVFTPDNGVTVVPETDKRQEYVPIEQAFSCDELIDMDI